MAENSDVARRQLTQQLKDLRKAKKLTQAEAADELEWSVSKLSRIEKGENSLRGHDAKAMCEVYGRPDLAETMMKLARAAKSKSWYHEYADVIPENFDVYIGMEEAASRFRWFESQLVPGLFQSEDYARTLIRTGNPTAPDEHIERRVQLRLKRQALLDRSDSLRQNWHVILPEEVLRRPVGGKEVMLAQLDRLLEVADRPNVTLGLIPIEVGTYSGIVSGPFVLLDFPDNGNGQPTEPPTVYIEGLNGALYNDDENQVRSYQSTFEGLEDAALDPATSKELIVQVSKEMKKK